MATRLLVKGIIMFIVASGALYLYKVRWSHIAKDRMDRIVFWVCSALLILIGIAFIITSLVARGLHF